MTSPITKEQSCRYMSCMVKLIKCKFNFFEKWLFNLNLIFIRIWMGLVFWRSGDAKVTGDGSFGLPDSITVFGSKIPLISFPFEITETTYMLFEYEYAVPYLPFEFAAISATLAEIILSLLIVFGFGARIAAFGLIIMLAVIEFTYETSALHYVWAMLLMVLVTKGPGLLSFDHLIRSKFNKLAENICAK